MTTHVSIKGQNDIEILKRFYFNSDIKRMSCIIRQNNAYMVVSKGSPESLRPLINNLPGTYDKRVAELTSEGYRVLALAYKTIRQEDVNMDR